ncbi:MAG: putative metalloendopeptidase [Phormidesmis priestleyi Ana]|uniref:Putative metalloendopeptidase n=1 Tax=Phormidesmis priestleyi Ana TaxID=1666911 RepID=A0A0P8C161_9CYAN|nr:MAG: putative metalloendopeptidase [Phormidesmis priestleyi Ana]
MRGFFVALLFLGVPTVLLGGFCFSLLQNNLRLSQTNAQLNEIATEVKAEVDYLGKEIDSLRERAGVTDDVTSGVTEEIARKTSDQLPKQNNLETTSNPASLLVLPVRGGGSLAKKLRPQGGPANEADAFDLLNDAKIQVPELSKALDSAIKPALEKTLAEESAYPDGRPVVGVVEVTSEFGLRSNPFGGGGYEVHEGIDFAGEQGDIIAAAGDGVVTLSGHNGGYGITVKIDHGYGYETLYAHMSDMRVQVGDRIKRGQIIGYIGSTGRSSGPHLHYGIYKDQKAINPRMLLKLPENNRATTPR